MEHQTTPYKRCDLIKVSGRIDTLTTPELEEHINTIVKEKKSGIVLDIADVSFISSRGLWLLLETQKKCKKNDRELILVNVSEDMERSFDIAGVKHFIRIEPDITSAVGSF